MSKQTISIPQGATEITIDTVDNVSGQVTPAPVPFTATVPAATFLFSASAVNEAPVVNAGPDISITLPTNSVTLNGNAVDSDGSIVSYEWSKVSGGTATIVSPTSSSTAVSGLVEDVYVFGLKVVDNQGASSFDDRTVTVKAAVVVEPPVGYQLVYSSGFETDKELDPFGHGQLANGSRSTDIKFSGASSFKALANKTNVSNGWRSEIQYDDAQTPSEGAWEYMMYVDNISSVSGCYGQFHGKTSGTSGQGSLWIDGGKFRVQRNTCGTAGCPNIMQSGSLQSVIAKQWYKIRHEIKFSKETDGYWRVYINDALYYNSGNTKTCDGSGQYFKIGINLFASPSSNVVVYFDDLKIYKKA